MADATTTVPQATTPAPHAELQGALGEAPGVLDGLAVDGAHRARRGVPIGYGIWLSLHEYSVRVAGLSRWAGLSNYSTALSDSEWWSAFFHTMIFAICSVSLELLIGLGMAMAMHAAFRGQGSCGPRSSCRGRC